MAKTPKYSEQNEKLKKIGREIDRAKKKIDALNKIQEHYSL